METLKTVIQRLNVSTTEMNAEIIQEILIATKKASISNEQFAHYDKILEKLWHHLYDGLEEFDDQLLCSTCFFSVLIKSDCKEYYLNKILIIINNNLELREKNIEKNDNYLAITLCYGIFQSSYLTQDSVIITPVLENILKSIFKLLVAMAYEYTQHTFIAFKTMGSFTKVIGKPLEMIIFDNENKIKFLNVINHNWENPITGIRNLNRILFQTLLQVIDEDMFQQILHEINQFYWNKAKYLMLTEIIHQHNGKIEEFVIKNEWLGGLLNSLFKPGLVSAGADMYYAILDKLHSENSWKILFLDPINEILTGSSFQAIENFKNYWCLNTFKKFPSLAKGVIHHLNVSDESENKLYSSLSVLKQANRLALIERNWTIDYNDDTKLVLGSTAHCNHFIRMTAFEIICVSHQKKLPTQLEYEQILNFLKQNINSDCTVLRSNMINNLGIFLTQLHNIFLNSSYGDDVTNLTNFCHNLQLFIIESLSISGNYQRKITTVKVTYTVFNCLIDASKKKDKNQHRVSKVTLLTFLKENNFWEFNNVDFILKLVSLLKDPASDVHENVLQLLSDYYITDFSNPKLINNLMDEGLTCIQSKFFYEISSGQNIFKLIIHILIKTKSLNNMEVKFKTIEDIFQFAYKEVHSGSLNKGDIVKSIEEGKQLHAYLGILYVIFGTSLKTDYKIPIQYDSIIKLVDILEIISNQFAWEEDTLTSSDFSKMNDMVQNLINNSEYITENVQDKTKISGLHQIVLNCLWLNVKATCDLASLLIICYKDYVEVCEKCLNIIMHVLETSRHKGAIEAAGAALGQGIYYLTSIKLNTEVTQLPFMLLEKKINELLFETAKMSSVTRRGAGLSIMVHRIVANDKKKGKPLFHYFMRKILKTCKTLDEKCETVDNDKDLPKAIYIHFLTKIVTDSSLASDIMYYSADLAELAFGNLTNSNWQIRNAALQLYGALIPKLIGQKKASGMDEETVATVGCDELRTHSPKLWKYIIKQIKYNKTENVVETHSNLVPILNVLANIARCYNFSYDSVEQSYLETDLLPNLTALLGSPINTVRRLTAKSIVNLYSFDVSYNIIKNNNCYSENHIHGCIMLISNLYKVYSIEQHLRRQLHVLINKFNTILLQEQYSYICKWEIEKLLITENTDNVTEELERIFFNKKTHRYEPGLSLWVNIKVRKYLQNAPWSIIPLILEVIITSNEFENYFEVLINRLEMSRQVCKVAFDSIANIILTSDLKLRSSLLWKLLYTMSLKADLNLQNFDVSPFCKYLNQVPFQMRYIVPFATRLCVKQRDHKHLFLLSNTIHSLCNPEDNDIDMRYIAAISNNELAHEFKNHDENIKINALKSVIVLLQDEEEDVRNLSVVFYKNIINGKEPKQPFICLHQVIDYEFLIKVLNQPKTSIPIICTDILSFIDNLNKPKDKEYNPFANDSKNVYFEVNLMRQLLFKLQNTEVE